MTQARLSQLTGSDPMTISQVVKALKKLGYFERAPHPDDMRARMITVSAAGREVASKAMKVVEATDQAFFEALGEENAAMVGLLRRLVS